MAYGDDILGFRGSSPMSTRFPGESLMNYEVPEVSGSLPMIWFDIF